MKREPFAEVRLPPACPTRRLWLVAAFAVLSSMAGIGQRPVEPVGQAVGLVQFDVVTELFADGPGDSNIVVFARCWVSKEYYAVSFVWTEELGLGIRVKGMVFFSDETAFRIEDLLNPNWMPAYTTYAKPIGLRPPLRIFVGTCDTRYAESEALAKRVYVSDFASSKGQEGAVEVNVSDRPDGVTRKLASLKAQIQDGRIESMELLDKQREPLATIHYRYERGPGSAGLSTLVAELPVRPQPFYPESRTTVFPDGQVRTENGTLIEHVRHKGGRTCTVRYEDVALNTKRVRLPVEIEVQRSDTKERLRSARLTNFKCVTLDKEGVRRAAEAFAGPELPYAAWDRLMDRFLRYEPNLGPPPFDPNDLTAVRRLVAKYPFFDPPLGPELVERTKGDPPPLTLDGHEQWWQEQQERRAKERAEQQRRADRWRQQVAAMPRPPRQTVTSEDARLIRQLDAHYDRQRRRKTEAQREAAQRVLAETGCVSCSLRPMPQDMADVARKLEKILRYHRFDPLPEDRAPEPNDSDIKLIRELREHYEELSRKDDRGLGGKLRALFALTRLDLMIKDLDALESHVGRYLQMVDEAKLNEMYLLGGTGYIESFVQAGRYERSEKLIRAWADRAATVNRPDAVCRWCSSIAGGRRDPWIGVQVLNRLLKRSDLGALERYEALAWRAIFLDKIDKALADPKVDEEPARAVQKQWVLRSTTPAQISEMAVRAIVEAAQAWGALGPARYAEAKPYSTENMTATARNMTEAPDATRLQETSAQLEAIVQRRMPPKPATPRLDDPNWRRSR